MRVQFNFFWAITQLLTYKSSNKSVYMNLFYEYLFVYIYMFVIQIHSLRSNFFDIGKLDPKKEMDSVYFKFGKQPPCPLTPLKSIFFV